MTISELQDVQLYREDSSDLAVDLTHARARRSNVQTYNSHDASRFRESGWNRTHAAENEETEAGWPTMSRSEHRRNSASLNRAEIPDRRRLHRRASSTGDFGQLDSEEVRNSVLMNRIVRQLWDYLNIGQPQPLFWFLFIAEFVTTPITTSVWESLGISASPWLRMSLLPRLTQQWEGVLGRCGLTIYKTEVDFHGSDSCWYDIQ